MRSNSLLRRLFVAGFALLFAALVGYRIWRYTTFDPAELSTMMPRQIVDEEEQALLLTPRGGYTAADIEANGRALPSQKYRGFVARHDANPQPGDRLCPITMTKANPDCTWIIGGREYQFCCPPCIAEFVLLARERPDQIERPEAYVKR